MVTIQYLLTISAQQKKHFILKESIDTVIDWLKESIPSLHVQHYAYETSGKYKQLHWHAIVQVKLPFRYKHFISYGDLLHTHSTFRIKWKRVYNERAIRYVYKDTHGNMILQDQIFKQNLYKHRYFNILTQCFEVIV